MIKIKLYDLEKHRNECTFRPYLWAQDSLKDVGIEFTTGDSYDYAWVGQASIIDKKVSLEESIEKGLEFTSKITGPYMLVDGQDSTSLIGTFEVLRDSDALLLLKSSLLKDTTLYSSGLTLGRSYWGPGDYKLSEFEEFSQMIKLSGTNWLSTHFAGVNVKWYDYKTPKQYDISAMFQYPQGTDVYEHGHHQSIHYDAHRKPMMDVLDKLDYSIAKLENGKRVPIQEYYQRISSAKILLAPFGYGEMAPRDLDAAQFGAVLIKPDMSYVDTNPNIFEDNVTYIACKHDYSDLEEKIDYVMSHYNEVQERLVHNIRERIELTMHPNNIAINVYNIFKEQEGIIT